MESNITQYDTIALKGQRDAIEKSVMDAMNKIVRDHYYKITGLDENDPQELFRFAVGNSEQTPNLAENKSVKMFAEPFRQDDPQYAENYAKQYYNFRKALGTPTLRETVFSLASRSKDDAELANWLEKLLALHRRGPIKCAEIADKGVSKDAKLLLSNWIRPPLDNVQGSFAFYSDRAMAKIIYFLITKRLLPSGTHQKAADRVRKIYCALGLRPADRRAIKDIIFSAGKFDFVLNKALTPKGR